MIRLTDEEQVRYVERVIDLLQDLSNGDSVDVLASALVSLVLTNPSRGERRFLAVGLCDVIDRECR